MAEGVGHTAHLETLPTLALEKIFVYLPPEDFSCLHVTSTTLFDRCSKFINHGRRECDALTWYDSVEYEANLRKYHERLHVFNLNVERLNPTEIYSLESHYRDYITYRLLRHKRGLFRYRPTVYAHVGFKLLERFYTTSHYKHQLHQSNINYKIVLDFLKAIDTNCRPWIHSSPDLYREFAFWGGGSREH